MEEWKTYKIKDICLVNTDQYSAKEGWQTILYLDTGNITENHIGDIQFFSLPSDELPSRARRKVKHNDIIFSTVRPNQRHYGILNHPADNLLVSTGFTVLTAKPGIADPFFVYYYLTQPELIDYLQGVAEQSVSAYPSLKSSDIEEIEIALPPIAEQKRLSSVLRSLDSKIELNIRINHNLEEQAQALYKSWFVDFEPFKGEKFVDSELGMIPEGWHAGTLSELLEVRYGKDHKALKDGNTPVFGSGGLMRYAERALYNGESVLIPRKGTLNNVMYFNGPFWTVDTMFYTVEQSSNVIKYCHLFLLTQDLASMNAGSAVPSMTTDILNNLPLLIPSSQVLEAFNRVISSIYEARSQREEESNSLSQSRDTILPQLMSGALTNTLLTC